MNKITALSKSFAFFILAAGLIHFSIFANTAANAKSADETPCGKAIMKAVKAESSLSMYVVFREAYTRSNDPKWLSWSEGSADKLNKDIDVQMQESSDLIANALHECVKPNSSEEK